MIPVMYRGKVFLWVPTVFPVHKLEQKIIKTLGIVYFQIYTNHIPCHPKTSIRIPEDTVIITIKIPSCLEKKVQDKIRILTKEPEDPPFLFCN